GERAERAVAAELRQRADRLVVAGGKAVALDDVPVDLVELFLLIGFDGAAATEGADVAERFSGRGDETLGGIGDRGEVRGGGREAGRRRGLLAVEFLVVDEK